MKIENRSFNIHAQARLLSPALVFNCINIVPVFDFTAGVSDGEKVCGRGSNQTKTVTVIHMK